MDKQDKLLKMINQGNSQAFEQIYDFYVKKIYRFVYYKTNSRETAEDITSETFCRIWKYVAGGNQIKNFKAFVYRTAYNLVINFYSQKQKTTLELKEELIETLPEKSGLEEKLELNSEIEHIKNCINKLPTAYQEVLILRFIHDLSISEISQVLNKSKNSVYVLIHRALKALKKELK